MNNKQQQVQQQQQATPTKFVSSFQEPYQAPPAYTPIDPNPITPNQNSYGGPPSGSPHEASRQPYGGPSGNNNNNFGTISET
eukprot:UN19333